MTDASTDSIPEWRKQTAEDGRLGDALHELVPDSDGNPVELVRSIRRTDADQTNTN